MNVYRVKRFVSRVTQVSLKVSMSWIFVCLLLQSQKLSVMEYINTRPKCLKYLVLI